MVLHAFKYGAITLSYLDLQDSGVIDGLLSSFSVVESTGASFGMSVFSEESVLSEVSGCWFS